MEGEAALMSGSLSFERARPRFAITLPSNLSIAELMKRGEVTVAYKEYRPVHSKEEPQHAIWPGDLFEVRRFSDSSRNHLSEYAQGLVVEVHQIPHERQSSYGATELKLIIARHGPDTAIKRNPPNTAKVKAIGPWTMKELDKVG